MTFQNPFRFAGMDADLPPGTYIVVTEEEEIAGLSFSSWHRVGTSLRLPALGRETGCEQVVSVTPQELAAAIARDNLASV